MGIVHRDIKPSNLILESSPLHRSHLAPRDGVSLTTDHRPPTTPHLWITDFGLARIDSASAPGLTMTGDLLGTLRYMSPEQALAKRITVDHRTDIYSLGVTLYETLTLRPIFPGEDRETLLRHIAFDEPSPPCKLNSAIPHDLETIVLKAIAKNPNERYATARELADDLQHLLHSEPVRARRATVPQKIARWSRRHRAIVAAGVVFLVIVAALATAASVMLAIERDKTVAALDDADGQRHRAEENYLTARQAVAQMLKQVADEQIAVVPGMRDIRRKLLEDARTFYTKLIKSSPRDAQVYVERARVHKLLRMHLEELRDYESVVDLDPGNAAVHAALAVHLHWRNKPGEGGKSHDLQEALRHARTALELEPDNGEAMWACAAVLGKQEQRSEALDLLKAFEEIAPPTASTSEQLASAYREIGEPLLALPHARRAIELDSDHFNAYCTLGKTLSALGRTNEAIEAYNEALRIKPFHYSISAGRDWERGDLLMRNGKFAEALQDYTRAVEINPTLYMPYKRRSVAHFWLKNYDQALTDVRKAYELHPNDLSTIWWIGAKNIATCPDDAFRQGIFQLLQNAIARKPSDYDPFLKRAEIFAEAGRYDEASSDWAAALGRAQSMDDKVKVLYVRANLSSDRGDEDEIQRTLEEITNLRTATYEDKRQSHGADHRATLEAMSYLASALWDTKHHEEALLLNKEAIKRNVDKHGNEDEFAVGRYRVFGRWHCELCEPEIALSYFKEAYRIAADKLGADHPCTPVALQDLALNYLDLHQPDLAIAAAEHALKLSLASKGKDHPETLASAMVLIRVYNAANQPEKSAIRLREFLPQLLESLNDKVHLGFDSMALAAKQSEVGYALINGGLHSEAESILRDSLAIRKKREPYSAFTDITMMLLGEALNGQGKYDEADPLLLQGYEGMCRKYEVRDWRHLIGAVERLVAFYEVTDQLSKAHLWQERLASSRAAIKAKRLEQLTKNRSDTGQESAELLTETKQ